MHPLVGNRILDVLRCAKHFHHVGESSAKGVFAPCFTHRTTRMNLWSHIFSIFIYFGVLSRFNTQTTDLFIDISTIARANTVLFTLSNKKKILARTSKDHQDLTPVHRFLQPFFLHSIRTPRGWWIFHFSFSLCIEFFFTKEVSMLRTVHPFRIYKFIRKK